MGVKGLQYYVDNHCIQAFTEVSIIEQARTHARLFNCVPLLAVDGMALIHKLYSSVGRLDWVLGGQWYEFVVILKQFVQTLTQNGICVVFFFDGAVSSNKRKEWVSRRLQRLKEVAVIFTHLHFTHQKPDNKLFQLPASMGTLTRFALKFECNCEVITTILDADQEISEFARNRDDCFAILSQDSDYLIFDTKPYLSVTTLDLETMTTVLYDRRELAKQLGLHVNQLPLFSCLMGNDIVRVDLLRKFHCALCNSPRNPSAVELVPVIANLINSNRWGGDPTDKKELSQIAYMIFSDQSYWELFSEGLRSYNLQFKDNRSKFYQPFDPSINCPNHTLAVARERHTYCIDFPGIFSLLCRREYESSTTLEDHNDNTLLPSALLFRPIRQKMYSLLYQYQIKRGLPIKSPRFYSQGLGDNRYASLPTSSFSLSEGVREWCAYPGNPLTEPEFVMPLALDIPGGLPTLDDLWKDAEPSFSAAQVSLRWQTFVACIGVSISTLKLQQLPAPYVTLCCVLNYLLTQPLGVNLKPFELAAFLAQAVSPSARSLECLANVQVSYVDSRAVQLASMFIRGVSTMSMVLSLCGEPYPLVYSMPWMFFDGKLFHMLYLQAKRRTSLEQLLEYKAQAVETFQLLWSVTTTGTLLANCQ
ncbi:constitutive coactivator of peroxisome proliferator-activated receptor gamma-like [Tachypleus tridentatus]|uniref:constitutive coactivator of peroxisome proliferator-activated receptor gamma-like n=1 Tax=Tachypleus tridentatus TaxID=6853 RepID=UPI003FD3C3CF